MATEQKICELFPSHVSNAGEIISTHREQHPGPSNFALTKCEIADAAGNKINTVKKNEDFTLNVWIYYDDMIGDLEPMFKFNATFLDLSSCDPVKSMCFSCEEDLKCDTNCLKLSMPMTCPEPGVFTVSVNIGLQNSDLFDFICWDCCFACQEECIHDEVETHMPGQTA